MKNKLDEKIIERAGKQPETEIYQARWVWYHTILVGQMGLTNILLIGILTTLAIIAVKV